MGFMGSCPSPASSGSTSITSSACNASATTSTTSKIPRAFPTTPRPSSRTTISITPPRFSRELRRIRLRASLELFARAISRTIRPPACRSRRIRQLYREADAILNVCGTQEFNDDLLTSDRILYIESDPGVEQIKVDKGVKIDDQISPAPSRSFHLRRKRRHEDFPGSHAQIEVAADAPAGRDRSLENQSRARGAAAVFTSVANWSTSGLKDIEWRGEKYLWSKSREFLRFVAAPKKCGRNLRARDRHQGRQRRAQSF